MSYILIYDMLYSKGCLLLYIKKEKTRYIYYCRQ